MVRGKLLWVMVFSNCTLVFLIKKVFVDFDLEDENPVTDVSNKDDVRRNV
jgi:hypothetical protein